MGFLYPYWGTSSSHTLAEVPPVVCLTSFPKLSTMGTDDSKVITQGCRGSEEDGLPYLTHCLAMTTKPIRGPTLTPGHSLRASILVRVGGEG